MTDILIRDVPDEVIAAIDAQAKHLGLSRTAYLRRVLEATNVRHPGQVSVDQLEHLSILASDLDDSDVMSDAWS